VTTDVRDSEDVLNSFAPRDRAAIEHTLSCLMAGFVERSAATLEDVYADDADWVNAFGSVKRGRRQIIDYLRGLFSDDNFKAGKLVAPPVSSFRRLADGVVAVSAHLQVEGQLLVGGGKIDLRDNHSLRILQKMPDGRWLIVSEMFMDARQDQSYINHS
jgi:uncharacterized protein (TIGR02246 family)